MFKLSSIYNDLYLIDIKKTVFEAQICINKVQTSDVGFNQKFKGGYAGNMDLNSSMYFKLNKYIIEKCKINLSI